MSTEIGTFKKLLVDNPVTLDEFRASLGKEFKRVRMNMARFAQGTPTRKRCWQGGRPRRVVDGRFLHHTKGFAKTERGGYAKRSRRSNGT